MQLKANGSYYPLQPILGNAGNPNVTSLSPDDNWNYYECLLLSNNFLFNTNCPLPKINQKNFAVNGRIYDTTNTRTLLPTSMYNKTFPGQSFPQYLDSLGAISDLHINSDTAMGQSWFH